MSTPDPNLLGLSHLNLKSFSVGSEEIQVAIQEENSVFSISEESTRFFSFHLYCP